MPLKQTREFNAKELMQVWAAACVRVCVCVCGGGAAVCMRAL